MLKDYLKIKSDFYKMTKFDLENNEPLNGIEKILKYYEELEMYIECAGIKQAIDEFKQETNEK